MSDVVTEMQAREAAIEVEARIIHLLRIYPVISPTMLQAGLGPYTKPAVWRPVLKRLVDDGKVLETQESIITPADRYNTYTKLTLRADLRDE